MLLIFYGKKWNNTVVLMIHSAVHLKKLHEFQNILETIKNFSQPAINQYFNKNLLKHIFFLLVPSVKI
jgi:hypothetical protein